MRAWLMVALTACLAGCPSEKLDMDSATKLAPTGELRIDGDDSLNILPGSMQDLSVIYVDNSELPVAGKWVEFGLMGSPEGASLDPVRAQTDDDGVATTTLVAGRTTVVAGTAPTFRVRASTEGLTPQYFDVRVEKAVEPTLPVSVTYAGKRAVQSISLLVVEGMTCDLLRSNAADIRMSITLALGETQTVYPGAGRHYAIAAWGSDDTNSKLAWGCLPYDAPILKEDPNSTKPFEVKLEDIAFSADTAIPLNFTVDLQSTLATLAPLARSVVADALPKTSTPQASFLLDALQTKVNFETARKNDGLDALLQSALDGLPAGPLRFADALAAAVAEDGSMCLLQGSLTPVKDNGLSAFIPDLQVYAVPSDSVAKAVSLSAVPLKLSEFSAHYDQDTAVVTIATLKISLGFGSYAAYLLDAIGQQPTRYAERVSASTGCSLLGALVGSRPASFPNLAQADAVTACESALAALVPAIRSKWAALDEQRNTLSLSGPLSAHDRDGDRKIDDLGPASLDGTWAAAGVAGGIAAAADPVIKASVRMSPVTVSAR
jgi:hypothetical protein